MADKHAQPVAGVPLWEQFKAECRRVIAEFGLDPDAKEFVMSRTGDHLCSLVKHGDRSGPAAEFGLQLSAAHRYADTIGFEFDARPELQFNGWSSPLAIALQLALYPLVFDPVPRPVGAVVVSAAYAFGLSR